MACEAKGTLTNWSCLYSPRAWYQSLREPVNCEMNSRKIVSRFCSDLAIYRSSHALISETRFLQELGEESSRLNQWLLVGLAGGRPGTEKDAMSDLDEEENVLEANRTGSYELEVGCLSFRLEGDLLLGFSGGEESTGYFRNSSPVDLKCLEKSLGLDGGE
ncbi:hypothetical protein Q3G72_020383 [Acer saccharum]|nr:hypothetical protein Q3G72_020383 [Acer saccharum]